MNSDGAVDLADVIAVLRVCAESSSSVPKEADISGDGRIGVADAIHILRQIARRPPRFLKPRRSWEAEVLGGGGFVKQDTRAENKIGLMIPENIPLHNLFREKPHEIGI